MSIAHHLRQPGQLLARQALRTHQTAMAMAMPRLAGAALAVRHTTHDHARTRIGTREIVGYGWNGSPVYVDHTAYPLPAIRFREPTNEICALRDKERCDWRKMSIEEKKQLYRYSFCQTFAEMKAPNTEWKLHIGIGLLLWSVGTLFTLAIYSTLYGDMPPTCSEERQRAQLKRIIALNMNPITGISSKWDYENNKWK